MTRPPNRVPLVALSAAGAALAVWPLWTSSQAACWGAILASWLFATGVALGCIALSAATQVTHASWAAKLNASCAQVPSFLPWSLLVLVALVVAGPHWLPWVHHAPAPERRWWLNYPGFAVRELLAAAALCGVAWLQVRRPPAERRDRTAVIFLLAYAVVLTLWSVDFVMALDREWANPVLGTYYFMGSLLGGVALLAFANGRRPERSDLRHDSGMMLFALATFWGNLTFVQTLVIWYGNLPEEIGFLLRRLASPWWQLSVACASLAFLFPFAVLMREKAKRNVVLFSIGTAGVLVGLWLEMQILVVPSLTDPLTIPIVSAALGSGIFFVSRLAAALQRAPALEA